ncbi:MAG: SCO4848 family membrane protein [Acidimicrobiales bacterium]
MSRRDALLLRAAAVWTVVIWAVFVKNQIGDDTTSTGFKVVHLTLAVVSMAFAVAIWRVASRSLRRRTSDRERAGTPS